VNERRDAVVRGICKDFPLRWGEARELAKTALEALDDYEAAQTSALIDAEVDAALNALEDEFPGFANGYNETFKREAIRRVLIAAARAGRVTA
jgi:hypothetical protein